MCEPGESNEHQSGAGSGAPPNSADSGASGDSGATSSEGRAESGASSRGGSAPAINHAGSGGDLSGGSGGAPFDGPIECAPGSTTTISGVVYDPAGANPLYNVMVYVLDPSSPLPDLDSVPLGCSCAPLLPEKVLATPVRTDVKGQFEIPCARRAGRLSAHGHGRRRRRLSWRPARRRATWNRALGLLHAPAHTPRSRVRIHAFRSLVVLAANRRRPPPALTSLASGCGAFPTATGVRDGVGGMARARSIVYRTGSRTSDEPKAIG